MIYGKTFFWRNKTGETALTVYGKSKQEVAEKIRTQAPHGWMG